MTASLTVLVVGSTGSTGSLAVAESMAAGHRTRALVRDQAKAHRLLPTRPTSPPAMSPDPTHSLPPWVVLTRS
ncbi:MAG TPA: NmrA family NAD(P)-binding protein [Microlunatus sp.]